MTKKSSFSERTFVRMIVDGQYLCSGCGKNHANCLHHIFGRDGDEESSPLNAAPMNNGECHLPRHGHWMTLEGQRFLFQRTLDFLIGGGYELDDRDRAFLLKYKYVISRLKINI